MTTAKLRDLENQLRGPLKNELEYSREVPNTIREP